MGNYLSRVYDVFKLDKISRKRRLIQQSEEELDQPQPKR